MLALIFLARRIKPFLSLVDREIEFCVLTFPLVGHFYNYFFYFLVRKNPSYRDSNSRPNVSEGCEVTNGATGATGSAESPVLQQTTAVVVIVFCTTTVVKVPHRPESLPYDLCIQYLYQ